MNKLLENKIKEAILNVRWKQVGDGPNPDYFVSAPNDSVKLVASAASFLATFITDYITRHNYREKEDTMDEFDKYSLEMMASYLEDKGYSISLPD